MQHCESSPNKLERFAASTNGPASVKSDFLEKPQKSRSLTITSVNADFVTSILITKDDIDLATLSEHVPARSLIGSPEFHVTGSLSTQPGERGYLELTWPSPTRAQTGNYRCDIDTVSLSGHSYDFSQNLQIQEQQPSLQDLLAYVHVIDKEREKDRESLSELRLQLQDIEQERSQLVDTVDILNQTIEDMQRKQMETYNNYNLNSTLEEIVKDISSLETQTTVLGAKVNGSNIHVFFSAGLTTTSSDGHQYSHNDVIVYDREFSNMGGGYSPHTGVFTCPMAGHYMFVVSVQSTIDMFVELFLQHNNRNVVFLKSYDAHDQEFTTVSVLLSLNTSDTVRVVSSGSSNVYSVPNYVSAVFTGYLVAPL